MNPMLVVSVGEDLCWPYLIGVSIRPGRKPGGILSQGGKIGSGETKGAKPSTLAALARAMGVSMERLATGEEGYV